MTVFRPAPRTRRLGFTMIELVVALIILSLLAVVAVPGSKAVLRSVQDSKATLTVDSVLQHAITNAAVRNVGGFDPQDLLSNAVASDELERGSTLVATSGPSTRYGHISFRVSSDRQQLGVAMLSESGTCVVGASMYPGFRSSWQTDTTGECAGTVALDELGYHYDADTGTTPGDGTPGDGDGTPGDGDGTPGDGDGTPGDGDGTPGDGDGTPGDDDGNPAVPDAPAPDAPSGVLPDTVPGQASTGEFGGEYDDAAYVVFEVVDGGSWNPSGFTTASWKVELEQHGTTVVVSATPGPSTVGTLTFPLRVRTEGGVASTSVAVASHCSGEPTQPAGSACARPTGTAAMLAGNLLLDNRNVIRGDLYVTDAVVMTNRTTVETELTAEGSAAGSGDVFAGSMTIPNGSHTTISGSVTLEGDFTNGSPQTYIGGSLTSSAGSISTSHQITVGGDVKVNAPNTVSGNFGKPGQVTSGQVVATSRPNPLKVNDAHIVYDQEFATWAQFTSWWSANTNRLGTVGRRTIKVNDGGTLPSTGSLVGDVLVVATGDVTVSGFPAAGLGPRTLTVATTRDLEIRGPGNAPVGLTAHLHADGTARVTNLTAYTGSLTAGDTEVRNNFTLNGRLISSYAGEVIWQQGFTGD